MIFRKFPQKFQKFMHYSALAAAISLLAITADARDYQVKGDITETILRYHAQAFIG